MGRLRLGRVRSVEALTSEVFVMAETPMWLLPVVSIGLFVLVGALVAGIVRSSTVPDNRRLEADRPRRRT